MMAGNRYLLKYLEAELRNAGDSAAAPKMQAYMKSTLPCYGIKSPLLKSIGKRAFKAYPLHSIEEWQDTILAMYKKPSHREWRYCAIQLLNCPMYKEYHTLKILPMLRELIIAGGWWDMVDAIAPYRLRDLLEQHPSVMSAELKRWGSDDNIWIRRAAILSQLRRKSSTDLRLLEAVIKPSLQSTEFFLQKAIGWALRDYAYTDSEWVEAFVLRYATQISPLSRREALKHLR